MVERPDRAFVVTCCGADVVGDIDAPPVPWWSLTKIYFVAAALVLVERGQLSLDAPLPGKPFTLRHLLQHTSGLRCYGAVADYHAAVARGDAPWGEAELLERSKASDLLFVPGQEWSYWNIGYRMVGQLIESATGLVLDAALHALVLAPLGAPDIMLAHEPAHLDQCAWGNPRQYHPGWVYSGLLVGRPKDAAILLHRLMTGRLLSPAQGAVMLDRRSLDVPFEGRPWRTAGYGLGLMMDIATPHGLCVGHTGKGPGSVAAAYRFHLLDPPLTIASFAPADDQAVVERLVLERANDSLNSVA